MSVTKAIFHVSITFRTPSDVIIPPFSAKASRLIMYKLSSLYPQLAQLRGPFKPIAITPIMRADRPLIKVSEEQGPLYLSAGEPYSFRATLVVDDAVPLERLLDLSSGKVDGFFGSSVLLDSVSLRCKRFDELGLGDPRIVRLQFLSPALLQLPSYGKFLRGRHVLFPLPSIMVRSLVDHWNTHCEPRDMIRGGPYLQLYANYTLSESDYWLKPVTVHYDEIRRPRGFVGWVVYEIRRRRKGRAYGQLMKLLDYAQYVGVGRSRATGFGQIALSCQ